MAPEQLTVLYIHGASEIGGAETELLTLLERLPALGYRPVVVCPDGPLMLHLQKLGIRTRRAAFPPWRKVRGWLFRRGAVAALAGILGEERPALIHVNEFWWLPQARRAAALHGARPPVVCHVRQEITPQKALRYQVDRADCVFAVSGVVESTLREAGVPARRLRVAHGGLDLARIPTGADGTAIRQRYGIPKEAVTIGTVANVFPRKGYDVMVAALPAVVARHPSLHYLIVGAGDAGYERRLRSMAAQAGLLERVHFAGFQDSVYEHVAAMDLYVHPALVEGFGIAVLDAMAMAKAVVATRTGGIPDIVLSDQTGVLVPSGDPLALGRAVIELLDAPARRQAMGAAGRRRVEQQFTADKLTTTIAHAYRGALAASSAGRQADAAARAAAS